MSAWPRKRLDDICSINPRLPKDHPLQEEQPVAFVPMAAVDELSGRIVEQQSRPFAEVRKGYTSFRDGDVLFAKITPCMENGKAAIANELTSGYGFGSTEFHVLRPGDKVIAEWLFYFVRQPAFRQHAKLNFSGTAGQQRVPTSFMSAAEIPLPPLPEQRRLVDILSRAEGIVRLRREAERKAAELIPALFIDLFGDPATNPKGWPVMTLGELIQNGPQNGLYKHASHYGDGTPILRIDAFYDGRVLDIDALKRVRITPDEGEKFRLNPRDIVINRVNSVEYLGKSAIIPPLPEAMVFESNMMRFAVDESRVLPEFVIELLQTGHAKAHFLSKAKHAINQSSINQQDVKSIRAPLPPLNKQRKFTEQVAAIRAIQSQQAAATAKAQASFDALLAEAFGG